jgi:hypothetical protein
MMSPVAHKIYISTMVVAVAVTAVILTYIGYSYYATGLEERFFHADNEVLKPSGLVGHGLGIVGTLLILIGIFSYMGRKRLRIFSEVGLLKHWLEFHIFLCSLGSLLILFHTSFKFGGLAAFGFWSLVAVVVSGVVGRFIYIQIPRSIEGRELSFNELKAMRSNLSKQLNDNRVLDADVKMSIEAFSSSRALVYNNNLIIRVFRKHYFNKRAVRNLKKKLKGSRLSFVEKRTVLKLVKGEILLDRRLEELSTMQRLFKYWHVAHLPFALILLVIMVVHVSVVLVMGYHWIF